MKTYRIGGWILNARLQLYEVETLIQQGYPELVNLPVVELPESHEVFEAWCKENGYADVAEPGEVDTERLRQAVEAYKVLADLPTGGLRLCQGKATIGDFLCQTNQ